MSGWAIFWGILLVVSLGCFAALSLVVSVLGLRDLRALFRGIEDAHDQQDGKAKPSS